MAPDRQPCRASRRALLLPVGAAACGMLLAAVPAGMPGARAADARDADVVVYGGTPAGLIAALAVRREGASVVVIEPTRWIGGMVTGGLSRTDVGNPATVGGYTREFFTRATARYGDASTWYAEPHVSMETFEQLLREAEVEVVRERRLTAVTTDGPRIVGLTTDDGTTHTAKVFIDASYEGDLMAAAGVDCIVGRESRARYGERLAGFHPMPIRPRKPDVMTRDCPCLGGTAKAHYVHGTPSAISGVDAAGRPIFGVVAARAEPGSADRLTQAYTYRLCVTRRPDIRVPFPKPATYDPSRYELLLRLIEAHPGIRFGRLFHVGTTVNGKHDLNSQGLFSTDYPGGNTGYPDGDHATRERIRQDHRDFIQGIFWFLCHDERVPQDLREQANAWGLCRDEFTDNGHWPYALYVREARRMVGEYVLTQKDLEQDVTKPDSVGMGSFLIDCHIVQRILADDGTVRDEGSFPDQRVKPYQIPYRSLTPNRGECDNLLVPVCLSASHVAYCSLRMEPVYMALGHASGVAAVMAARAGSSVQAVEVPRLQARLREQRAVLELPRPPADEPRPGR